MSITHLLDTSWVIRHLRGEAAYTHTMQHLGAAHLAISIVSLAELYEGVFRAADRAVAEQALRGALTGIATLPLDGDICRLFGEHRAQLRLANQLIGDVDLFIAVTCLHYGLALLTTNCTHFERVPGLQIIATPMP